MDELENSERKLRKTLLVLVGILVVMIFVVYISVFPHVFFRDLAKTAKYFLGDASSTVTVSIANYVPTITSQYLNGGGSITLTDNATKTIHVTATITDYNGCEDLDHATVAVYKIGTPCASSGDNDNDNCYFASVPITCSLSNSYNLDKTFDLYYYADQTAQWKATIIPFDKTPATGLTYDTGAVTVNPLQSLAVSALDYGTLQPGTKSSSPPDHTAIVTNTGNTPIDFNLSGTALTCSSGCIGSIPAENQKYSLTVTTGFDTGGTALSSVTPAAAGANLAKRTQSADSTQSTYWQISVPNGVKGALTGFTTFSSKTP